MDGRVWVKIAIENMFLPSEECVVHVCSANIVQFSPFALCPIIALTSGTLEHSSACYELVLVGAHKKIDCYSCDIKPASR